MKYEYDKTYRPIREKSIYKEELELIDEFIKSEHQNICFTYEMVELARNAYAAIRKYIVADKLPVKLKQRKKMLVVIRSDGKIEDNN